MTIDKLMKKYHGGRFDVSEKRGKLEKFEIEKLIRGLLNLGNIK